MLIELAFEFISIMFRIPGNPRKLMPFFPESGLLFLNRSWIVMVATDFKKYNAIYYNPACNIFESMENLIRSGDFNMKELRRLLDIPR